MNIVAYLKPVCGWSGGVREVFQRYNLEYEEKLINEGENYAEMVTKIMIKCWLMSVEKKLKIIY